MKAMLDWFPMVRRASRSNHRRRSTLHLEALESRRLMAADALPVLMVIADGHDFYYREYNETRIGIEQRGVAVEVAARTTNPSTPHLGTGQGPDGGIVTPDLRLDQVDSDDYSAIVFVGGWGSSMYQYAFQGDYQNDLYDGDLATKTVVNDLINQFAAQDKFVTAICHGVTVLAWARVDGVSPLAGKQVSVPFIGSPAVFYQGAWYGNYQLGQQPQAAANGAITNTVSGQYGLANTVTDDVVVDGRIITAENYDAALEFGRRIGLEVLAAAAAQDPPAANQPPTALDAAWQIDENGSVGTVVGVVSASDPDAGQLLSFAITGGNTGGAFAINPATGQISVVNTSVLDFETTPVFQLTVQVADDGQPSLNDTAVVTIQLRDLLEAAPGTVALFGGDIHVKGTSSADTIYIWSGSTDQQVFVWMNGVFHGARTLPAGGRVRVFSGDGNDQVFATDARAPMTIDGEGGHDLITGGSAADVLLGGDGYDRISGLGGNDLIRGGVGNDSLYGNDGDDLILGEAGDDVVDGHAGRDLIIGGLGRDYVQGGVGEDLLIGGTTQFDLNELALAAIRSAWSGPGGFQDRANQLAAGIGGGIRLAWGQGVLDDGSSDTICGGAGADLIFLGLLDPPYPDADDRLELISG